MSKRCLCGYWMHEYEVHSLSGRTSEWRCDACIRKQVHPNGPHILPVMPPIPALPPAKDVDRVRQSVAEAQEALATARTAVKVLAHDNEALRRERTALLRRLKLEVEEWSGRTVTVGICPKRGPWVRYEGDDPEFSTT